MTRTLVRRADDDYDAIVVGAGHNGLITAAYLARGGLSVLLLEARERVGGTAASEPFAGATVNVCNCDHVTFRTTPVSEELRLADHGMRYIDMEPSQYHMAWSDGTVWSQHHDLDATLASIGRVLPGEVDGFHRFMRAALPAVRLVFAAANEQPSRRALTRLALRKRFAGVRTLLSWSRRSAADVLRSYFTHDALTGTGAMGGPVVWGISPETPGSGLGALSHATKHVGRAGRPVGGSGAMPEAVRSAFEAAGGTLRLSAPVEAILCEGDAVRGVRLVDGTEVRARVVVSACDPHRTFLEWLRDPPAAAAPTIARWRAIPQERGYEAKIDAVVSEVPVLRSIGEPVGSTVFVAPSLAEIDAAHGLLTRGAVAERPCLLVNVPTVVDPSLAPLEHPDRHVLSVEVLYTPYDLEGGWPGSPEPGRWLELLAGLCEPGLLDTIVDHRAMTPDVYEREFHLPFGHATSFAGGPLAVFRQRDPELTSYETAVPGLYLTGAATFPGAGVWGASGRNCAAVVLDDVS